MQLKVLKDSALVRLKNDVVENEDKYCYDSSWIDSYLKDKGFDEYLVNTNILIDDFELKIGDQSLDAENAVILHKAMSNLLPIQAREEKLWTYLTHTRYWNYMKTRWPIKICEEKGKNKSRILSRYFFQGKNENKIKAGTVPYVRNGLARLWWAGYVVYNEELENPYEYINELFLSQDMFVGLCERDIAKNKNIVFAVLKAVRKYNLKSISNNTELVRNILKDINMSAGLVMYDALDDEVIETQINEIFEDNISKSNKGEI